MTAYCRARGTRADAGPSTWLSPTVPAPRLPPRRKYNSHCTARSVAVRSARRGTHALVGDKQDGVRAWKVKVPVGAQSHHAFTRCAARPRSSAAFTCAREGWGSRTATARRCQTWCRCRGSPARGQWRTLQSDESGASVHAKRRRAAVTRRLRTRRHGEVEGVQVEESKQL